MNTENNTNPPPTKVSFLEKNATFLKTILIFILLAILTIPQNMVNSLIWERQSNKSTAQYEVSQKWGDQQTIIGPIVSVPYVEFYREDTSKSFQKVIKFAHFLPEELSIKSELFPEKRHRSIYEIIVYTSKMHFEGYFDRFNVASLGVPKENILWNYASLSVGINDLRGIEEQVEMNWNNQKILFNPGMESNDVIGNGVSSKVPIKAYTDTTSKRYSFSFDLILKGSDNLNFVPVGKVTNVNMVSAWPSPKFDGAFLPDTNTVSANGFTANWKLLHVNRNFPQYWLGSMSLYQASFGVNLLLQIDNYKQSDRAVKYSFILISLTFAMFFFIEMLNKRKIHPFHYILVGLGLCLFFTLLISISEHLAFSYAYIIAMMMTVGLIYWYTNSILNDPKLSKMVAAVLGLLYLFVFVIVQLEDYALLVGSFGLFAALATIMHFSRKIDWYGNE